MKITNKLNLPTPFVDAVKRDYEYTEKRYSVTSMLKGFREIILTRRHWNEMETDVSDSIWLLFGTAVHKILEQAQEADDELKETKIYYTFPNGYTLSGQQDLYSESQRRITDYKTGNVWKVIMGDWEDYRKQCLYYCLLFRKNGFPCDNAEIVMLLKNWSKTDAKSKSNYPERDVFIKHFDFTPQDFIDAEAEIMSKFNILDDYKDVPDELLPLCTKEERWATDDTYACYKGNSKRAAKLFDNREDAEKYVAEGNADRIELREATDKKCIDYCSCCQFCDYWREKYGKENI